MKRYALVGNDQTGSVIIGCRSNNYFQGCGGGWFRGRTPRPPWHKAALTGRKSWQRDRKRNQCNYRSKLININLIKGEGFRGRTPPGTKPPLKVRNETRCFDWHKTTYYDCRWTVIIGLNCNLNEEIFKEEGEESVHSSTLLVLHQRWEIQTTFKVLSLSSSNQRFS